jgi:hypothetical protein
MTRSFGVVGIAAASVLGSISNASALCVYHGQLYAKTTLEEEFREAHFVLKVTVLSCRNIYDPDTGVACRVRVDQSFKGRAAPFFIYYTERNSGGFYLDVERQYLLFLNPIDPTEATDDLGPGWMKNYPAALEVNYNCGQSCAWAKVPLDDRKLLRILSGQSR